MVEKGEVKGLPNSQSLIIPIKVNNETEEEKILIVRSIGFLCVCV